VDAHRLLIVEDHDSTRTALEKIFAHIGWHVSSAATLAEGLVFLEAELEPCCVILDLMLPDGDGEAILKRIREKGFKTRTIICTAVSDADRMTAVNDLEPDLVLTKPVTEPSRLWSGPCMVCGGR
jgi:two-component system, OmpR family, KDP operon response regulator KdpE